MPRWLLLCAIALAVFGCHRDATDDVVAHRAVIAPPVRPSDVVAEVHFGQPRATAEMLGRVVGRSIPLDLVLVLALGIDSSVLAATDASRPIDVIVTAEPQHVDLLYVLTPRSLNEFRGTLQGRFLFTPVAGLGERLDPRHGGPEPALQCAIVGVPDAIPSRVVCASRLEALNHAGRFAAYRSQATSADHGDATLEVDGAASRSGLLPTAQNAIDDLIRELAVSAAAERREHARAPEFGDPERVVAVLSEFSRNLRTELADIRTITARTSVTAESVVSRVDVALDASGRSLLARDAAVRVGVPAGHPLLARLPPDALFTLASRTSGERGGDALPNAIDAFLGVMGPRIGNTAAARATLVELLAHVGDEVALAIAPEPDGGDEVTLLANQDDAGVAARAVIARLATAPWLRAIQIGDARLAVASDRGALTVALPSAPIVRDAATATNAPSTLAITVSNGVLAFLRGHGVSTARDALDARTTGPLPSVTSAAQTDSLVVAVDTRLALPEAALHGVVTLSYGAARTRGTSTGSATLTIPAAALGALRGR